MSSHQVPDYGLDEHPFRVSYQSETLIKAKEKGVISPQLESPSFEKSTLLSHWNITRSSLVSSISCKVAPMIYTPAESPKSPFKSTLYSYFHSTESINNGVSDHENRLFISQSILKCQGMSTTSPFESLSLNHPVSLSYSLKSSKHLKSPRSSPFEKDHHRRKVIRGNSPVLSTNTHSLDNYTKNCSSSILSSTISNSMFSLPTIGGHFKDAIPRISCSTLLQVLNGDFSSKYNSIFIIDARFWYEHQGGHIPGAINCCSPTELEKLFFSHDAIRRQQFEPGRTAIIFHCEFSSHRAPKLALSMRKKDRTINTYPMLCYPELYVLQGGYCEFFKIHPKLCQPSMYIPMNDSMYKAELNVQMKFFRSENRVSRNKFYTPIAAHTIDFTTDEDETNTIVDIAFLQEN